MRPRTVMFYCSIPHGIELAAEIDAIVTARYCPGSEYEAGELTFIKAQPAESFTAFFRKQKQDWLTALAEDWLETRAGQDAARAAYESNPEANK